MSDTTQSLLAIGVGGAAGALARYSIGLGCESLWGSRFGHGTLIVNVLGCFVLGLLMHEAWSAGERMPTAMHHGLTIGLLGGLTTFSTFGYQTLRHLEANEPWLALANVALNLVLGLAAAAAGLAVSRLAWPAPPV